MFCYSCGRVGHKSFDCRVVSKPSSSSPLPVPQSGAVLNSDIEMSGAIESSSAPAPKAWILLRQLGQNSRQPAGGGCDERPVTRGFARGRRPPPGPKAAPQMSSEGPNTVPRDTTVRSSEGSLPRGHHQNYRAVSGVSTKLSVPRAPQIVKTSTRGKELDICSGSFGVLGSGLFGPDQETITDLNRLQPIINESPIGFAEGVGPFPRHLFNSGPGILGAGTSEAILPHPSAVDQALIISSRSSDVAHLVLKEKSCSSPSASVALLTSSALVQEVSEPNPFSFDVASTAMILFEAGRSCTPMVESSGIARERSRSPRGRDRSAADLENSHSDIHDPKNVTLTQSNLLSVDPDDINHHKRLSGVVTNKGSKGGQSRKKNSSVKLVPSSLQSPVLSHQDDLLTNLVDKIELLDCVS